MASSNQGGSILSFLIIGGVMAVLLIGGAYFVQQRASHPAPTQTPAATKPTNQSEDKKVADEPKKDESKPVTSTQPESNKDTTAQQSPSAELPQTGMAEVASSILGAGLLTGMIVAYIRSRRLSVTL